MPALATQQRLDFLVKYGFQTRSFPGGFVLLTESFQSMQMLHQSPNAALSLMLIYHQILLAKSLGLVLKLLGKTSLETPRQD